MAPKPAQRKGVKGGLDLEETRRRRNDTSIKLRKNNKDEALAKRRHMTGSVATPNLVEEQMDANVTDTTSSSFVGGRRIYSVVDIPILLGKLQNPLSNTEELLEGIKGFRRMLSAERDPPVQAVLDSGALELFIKLLDHNDPDIQFEAAWALTNVASTEHTAVVVQYGAVPHLVKLLMSYNPNVREQCAWCLGNIAGDSPELRDAVLNAGGLEPLLQNIREPANASLLGNAVWTLSNFCRGKPQPDIELVRPALPILAFLTKCSIKEVVMDACWALSYLSDGSDERIDEVMNCDKAVPICNTLVELLDHDSTGIVTPVLRTLGNFVSGNDKQTQAVIDAGVIKYVFKLFKNSKRNIRKETFWLISNIAAGTKLQINVLMRSQALLQHVLTSVEDAEFEIRKEAMWVVNNIITGGSDQHVEAVCALGAIRSLSSMLTVQDAKILTVVLGALEKVFAVGERLNKNYALLFDEAEGIEHLEALQEHENEEVYEKSVLLLEQFFGAEEANENENLEPKTDGNAFSFGVAQKLFEDDASDSPMQFNFTHRSTNV